MVFPNTSVCLAKMSSMLPLVIAIVGAASAILVSLFGALLANRNNIRLQTRKLKEEHYIVFLEALHHLASDNNQKEHINNYVLKRDKLFLIANENVIRKLFEYEENAVGKPPIQHDQYLTALITEIRKDLGIYDKNLPTLHLKK